MKPNDSIQSPAWFTIKEAASYLNVGEPTIYRWMRENRITYRKVGDSTRFLQEDLDSLVDVFPSQKDSVAATELCPLCHCDVLIDGDLRSTGLVYFHPEKARFWTLRDSNIQAKARMCSRCGFVMLRADLAKLAIIAEHNRKALDEGETNTLAQDEPEAPEPQ